MPGMRMISAAALVLISTARADTIGGGAHLGGSSGHEIYVGADFDYEHPLSNHLSAVGWLDVVSISERSEDGTGPSGCRVAAMAALRIDVAAPDHSLRPYLLGGGGIGWATIGDPSMSGYRGAGPGYLLAVGADVRLSSSVWLRGQAGFAGFRFDGTYLDQDAFAALLAAASF